MGTEFDSVIRWPEGLVGQIFRIAHALEWALLGFLTSASYFLGSLLLLGRRRVCPARIPSLVAGAGTGLFALLFAPVIDEAWWSALSCGLAMASAMVLLTLASHKPERPARSRKRRALESYSSRRSSQPFAFGLASACSAIVIWLTRHLMRASPEGRFSDLAEFLPTIPIKLAMMGVLFGALFALGGALIGLIRRGATAAAPYGAMAGVLCTFVAEFVRPVGNLLVVVLCYFALAAGAVGTMIGPEAPEKMPPRFKRYRRRS